MSVAESFTGVRELIASAKDHLADLGKIIAEVVDEDCVSVVAEVDPDSLFTFYKLRAEPHFPPRAAVRAFNIAVELRAALDHAVYAAAVLINPQGPSPTKTAFFVGKTQAAFEGGRDGKGGSHVPPEIKAVMTRLQPYRGGRGQVLADLNEFRNIKDHRRLIDVHPVFGATKSSLVAIEDPDSVFAKSLPPHTGTAHNEIEIQWMSPGFKLHPEKAIIQSTVEVVFREPAQLEGVLARDFFAASIQAVEHAVGEIEAEATKAIAARRLQP